MIEFKNVSFRYSANKEDDCLKNVSFQIPEGQCVLLTGPSGCGKSTIIRLLNGLIPEFYRGEVKGEINVLGENIAGGNIYNLVGKVGTVFQNPRSQFFNVDTTSELAFGCENLGLGEEEILKRIDETVLGFALVPLMDRNIFELSGGEKQCIACASVDVLRPELILLDEPSANLDYSATGKLRDMILRWKKMGKTILIAEHRINYLWDIIDRAIILNRGMCIKDMIVAGVLDEKFCKNYGLRTTRRISPYNLAIGDCIQESGKEKILFQGFSYEYEKNRKVFDIDEFYIDRNTITAIIGENGAGKTTLLECICGLKRNNGIMKIGDKIYKQKDRLKEIFMVLQDTNHQLFAESVMEEIMISMPEEDVNKAREILHRVDLQDLEERHPLSLSGGQKQRLAIACGIASLSNLLLLDEPTSGLDYEGMIKVAKILKELKEEGRTIIAVTHDAEFIQNCCDRMVLMKEQSYG